MILYGALPYHYNVSMSKNPYRQQKIKKEGDLIHIKDVRNFQHHSIEYVEENYYDRTYDSNDVIEANYIIAGFERPMNLLFAHVFITFEFANGVFLSVSSEAGRTTNAPFSFYKGFTGAFPLLYVFADEYDVLRARTNINKFDTYMYPIDISAKNLKKLFLSIINRALILECKTEQYHLINNSCVSELYGHLNKLSDVYLPTGWGKLFPAWLDFFAHRRGLFNTNKGWLKLRHAHRITELGKQFDSREKYSFGIRNRLNKK